MEDGDTCTAAHKRKGAHTARPIQSNMRPFTILQAFAPRDAGRALPAQLPRTWRLRSMIGTPSSRQSLLLAAKTRTDEGGVVNLRHSGELWGSRYRELKEYRDEHGDCNVPRSQGSLGKWVSTQRQSYKEGKLSNERVVKLESIGFVWNKKEQKWSNQFDDLTKYKAQNGDCNVSTNQGSLGVWVKNQRQFFKNGKLSQERIASLEKLGFVWERYDEAWMTRFDELGYFKNENGDCNVPESQGPLGMWVQHQRQFYKKGILPQERIDLLESIDFVWEPFDEAWMARFDELVDFKNENGDCNVPKGQGSLGWWVNEQRVNYKNGKLSQERIEFLESVGFEWVRQVQTRTQSWKLDELWKMKYTELVQYLIEHGNFNVPRKYGPLFNWVGKQRTAYKDGNMSQFRIDYLDSIGFAWKLKRVGKEAHPDQYSEPDLKAIARIIEEEKPRHDDLLASATDSMKTRVNVGKRLAESLQEYLDDDTVRLMQTYEKLKTLDVEWQTRYTELVHFLIEHGNCNVPRKDGPLSNWVSKQRQLYKKGTMSQPRKEYLEIIGFAWTTKRVDREWHPDQYSKPDPEAIAKMIVDEKSRLEEFPSCAPEGLKVRVKADRDLVEALQECLDNLENSQ